MKKYVLLFVVLLVGQSISFAQSRKSNSFFRRLKDSTYTKDSVYNFIMADSINGKPNIKGKEMRKSIKNRLNKFSKGKLAFTDQTLILAFDSISYWEMSLKAGKWKNSRWNSSAEKIEWFPGDSTETDVSVFQWDSITADLWKGNCANLTDIFQVEDQVVSKLKKDANTTQSAPFQKSAGNNNAGYNVPNEKNLNNNNNNYLLNYQPPRWYFVWETGYRFHRCYTHKHYYFTGSYSSNGGLNYSGGSNPNVGHNTSTGYNRSTGYNPSVGHTTNLGSNPNVGHNTSTGYNRSTGYNPSVGHTTNLGSNPNVGHNTSTGYNVHK